MTMRPVPARWFEVLVATEDLVKGVEALARTGDIELEVYSETTQRVSMPNLRDQFADFDKLLRRYQQYWPSEYLHPSEAPARPDRRLADAVARLSQWQQQADPIIDQLEILQGEYAELEVLQSFLSHLPDDEIDFTHAGRAGPALGARLFVLPAKAKIQHLPPAVLSVRVLTDNRVFLLVVGAADVIDGLQRDMQALKGQVITLPAWLTGKREVASQQVSEHQQALQQQIDQLYGKLAGLEQAHTLHEVLGDIEQMEWFITHVTDLPVSENFAWITGWTSDVSEDCISDILGRESIRAVVHYPQAPMGVSPPMVFHNPWLSRPFEFFAKLLGVPAADELDPSIMLSLIVPVIFGYMFGDVGHGLVFTLAGLLLQKRWPPLRILVSCGLSSMLFGWVFGSVFASEHIIAPLWVNPIQQPLPVLAAPLAGGVLVLLLGLTANGIQLFWQGQWRQWLAIDAAVIVIYLSVIGSVLDSRAWVMMPIGVLWYFAGSVALASGPAPSAIGHALGQLVESVLQLLINTISFIRVGAFALAHAGLSLAVFSMANTASHPVVTALILVLGNILILVLEGLVVSIQTTRLVLFEFFIRFLKGTGRMFQPLTMPTNPATQPNRRSKP
jgi:V/A-type H+/Na+-transporting ATPase subunit I